MYKTRALAAQEIGHGRVWVNDLVAKPSREVHPGDRIELRQSANPPRTLVVRMLSAQRGPASVAQALYEETPESVLARQQAAERRRMGVEPGLTIDQGRPTKRDRRQIGDWQRWSASIDDD